MLNHLEELKALNLQPGDYAIFGSGPLAVRNLREAKDIDFIVSDKIWPDLKNKYLQYYNPEKNFVSVGNLEFSNTWTDFAGDPQALIKNAEFIEGLPFVRLEYVLEWKKNRGSEKDLRDIELINGWLKTNHS
jgi:hypothetical protein